MPFLRLARDKRGYEHTYLIHTSTKKGGATRILYWYRTPPGVRVGRMAFDDDVRRALETQYPSITFDWPKLMEAPPPPPDVEHWRERRRIEKAARQARRVAERDDPESEPSEATEPNDGDDDRRAPPPWNAVSAARAAESAADLVDPTPPSDPVPIRSLLPEAVIAEVVVSDSGASADGQPEGPAARTGRKRRRRGGRRRRRPGQADADPSGSAAAAGDAPEEFETESGLEAADTVDADDDGDPSSEASE